MIDDSNNETDSEGLEQLPEPQKGAVKKLLAQIEYWKSNRSEGLEGLRDRLAEIRSGINEVQATFEDGEKPLTAVSERLEAFEKLVSPDGLRQLIFEMIAEKLPDAPVPESAVEAVRAKLLGMSDQELRQFLYLQRVVLTDDAFGIIVRGHVLIENALQACIYAYVPNPVDLYRKLEMFFAQKIRLAYMLGVIDDNERRMLNHFNKLRNDIAHFGEGVENDAPDFHLTAKEEESLWRKFVANKSMGGKWPSYDASKFPRYLRYVVMYLYVALSARANELKVLRLPSVVEKFQATDLDKSMRTIVPIMLVNVMTGIGQVDLDSLNKTHTGESQIEGASSHTGA